MGGEKEPTQIRHSLHENTVTRETRDLKLPARPPRRLRTILSLADFEHAARRHLPRPIFGYVAGGVEDTVALRSAAAAYREWSFVPRVLVDVSQRVQEVELFGDTYSSPFGIAPMGISALIAYEGDLALARAAEKGEHSDGRELHRLDSTGRRAPGRATFDLVPSISAG